MPKEFPFKYLCCIDLTIASRLIGLIGLAFAVALTAILLHDKYDDDYANSRICAIALGLDWHGLNIKPNNNTAQIGDLDGKRVSTILTFYALLYGFVNMLLILATIIRNRWFTIPWLISEVYVCLSKIEGTFFHLTYDPYNINATLAIGSAIYVVLVFWLALVVIAAQSTWKRRAKKVILNLNMTPAMLSEFVNPANGTKQFRGRNRQILSSSASDDSFYSVL